MTHQDIDRLVKSWIVDSAIRPANPNRPSTSRITPITIITVPDFLGGAP